MLRPHHFDLGIFPVEKTIQIVANYLELLTTHNDVLYAPSRTQFHAQSVPTIDILSYLVRIQKYCPATNECYLAIIVYVHHLIRLNATKLYSTPITVDSYSIHRLVITSIVLAAKLFSDIFFTNHRYAKVGGIKVDELNRLEVSLLLALDFKLFIPETELQYYGDHLIQHSLSFSPPTIEDLKQHCVCKSTTTISKSCDQVCSSLNKLSISNRLSGLDTLIPPDLTDTAPAAGAL